MFRVLILVTVSLVAIRAEPGEEAAKCLRLTHPSSHRCCKGGHPPIPQLEDSTVHECMQLQGKGPSCDREICFASKLGVASSDGTIDKAALQNLIEKNLEDNADLSKAIVDNCVNGDTSKYGRADLCDLMKFKICKDVQFTATCPEWDNEGPCAGIKELAEDCTKMFA